MAGSICKKEYIYYCPICAKADIKSFGEPYIHREHQLQGVLICPYHACWLKKYDVKRYKYTRLEFIRLETSKIDLSNIHLCREQYRDGLTQIACSAYYLLCHDLNNINKDDILLRYKHLLYEKGLATHQLRIKQKELYESVIGHYGADLLNVLESALDDRDEYNWLRVATRDVARTVHPLRHILLILFLTGDIESFFQGIRKSYNPFGEGAWPCLNKAADHYRENVVYDLKISADSKTRNPIGTFTCNCGFIYSRMGPDRLNEDRYRKPRVKTFGRIWEEKLKSLLEEKKLSYRKMALCLDCDIKTIHKFEHLFAEKIITKTELKPIDLQATNDFDDKYKKSVLSMVKENPDLSRTAIRKLCPKEYTFLYRHAKEWLFNVLPKNRQFTGSTGYIDWEQRDQQILLLLQQAYNELSKNPKPIRICKTALAKKTGKLSLIEKHLDKLSLCKKFISKVSENKQQFQLRRCKIIIDNMKKQGIPLIEWKIQRQAGLSKLDYELIKDKLDLLLQDNEVLIYYG